MTKILLVEDNQRYAQAAEQYLASQGVALDLAQDYSQAMARLSQPGLDGVITDCFFPETTGSGRIDKGKEAIDRMAEADPRERRIVQGLEKLGKYVNLHDPDALKYARFSLSEDRLQEGVMIALEHVATTLDTRIATESFKGVFMHMYKESRVPKDYYGALREAIEKSEANQPLGILVAEIAGELGLPFVLATSTHHHDILTQPIQHYTTARRWTLVDCVPGQDDEKASPQFWERVWSQMERKLP